MERCARWWKWMRRKFCVVRVAGEKNSFAMPIQLVLYKVDQHRIWIYDWSLLWKNYGLAGIGLIFHFVVAFCTFSCVLVFNLETFFQLHCFLFYLNWLAFGLCYVLFGLSVFILITCSKLDPSCWISIIRQIEIDEPKPLYQVNNHGPWMETWYMIYELGLNIIVLWWLQDLNLNSKTIHHIWTPKSTWKWWNN